MNFHLRMCSFSCGKPCGGVGNENFQLKCILLDPISHVEAWEMKIFTCGSVPFNMGKPC